MKILKALSQCWSLCLNIASFSRVVEVAVCSDMADEALLGTDLGLDTLSQWLHLVGNKTVCQTRAQAALEQAKEIADRDALASSGAVVHSLGDIFNFDDNFFTPEPMHATPPYPTPSQLLLPELTSDPSDKLLLIEQQAKDPSLSTIRELGQQQLRGYAYLDSVVIHTDCTDALSPVRRVVLPSARRLVALKLAHNSDFGGHCGVKRSLK